ncbi:MAG: ROK family protein [Coprobacillus sp.]
MTYYAGIDIGGTSIKMGVIDELGKVHQYEKVETPVEKIELMNEILCFVQKNSSYHLEGVGVSMPGIITEEGYAQTSGAIKCFFRQNIKEQLEEHLGLPVSIENDGKSAGLAEKWIGAAQNIDNFVCMTLGTAIGGSVFIDGQLKKGLGGLAGEFGIALTSLDNPCSENSYASHAATVGGLCRQYSYAIKERILDAKVIIEKANSGDEIAQKCLDDFYNAVAILAVNLSVILAPEVIFIGGGISENEEVVQKINEHYQKICQEYRVLSIINMPQLMTCQLKNHAGMIGAVYSFIVEHNKNFQ